MKRYYPYDKASRQRLSETFIIADGAITLSHLPLKDSLEVEGFTATGSANVPQGYFFYNYSENTDYREATGVVKFNAADNGTTVTASYIAVGTLVTAADLNEIKAHLENDSIHGGGSQYTLPTASAGTLGGVKVGDGLSIDSNGVLSASGSAPPCAFGIVNDNGTLKTDLTTAIKIEAGSGQLVDSGDMFFDSILNVPEEYRNDSSLTVVIIKADDGSRHTLAADEWEWSQTNAGNIDIKDSDKYFNDGYELYTGSGGGTFLSNIRIGNGLVLSGNTLSVDFSACPNIAQCIGGIKYTHRILIEKDEHQTVHFLKEIFDKPGATLYAYGQSDYSQWGADFPNDYSQEIITKDDFEEWYENEGESEYRATIPTINLSGGGYQFKWIYFIISWQDSDSAKSDVVYGPYFETPAAEYYYLDNADEINALPRY